MKYLKLLIITILLPSVSFGKELPFRNQIFRKSIKTVVVEDMNGNVVFPSFQLNSNDKLVLRFDDLSNAVNDYTYSFIHCNHNWTASKNIFPNDYYQGIEEEFITDFEYSRNTLVPYVHYKIKFPDENHKLLLSGNYIIVVKDNETQEVAFTQKFVVTENRVSVQTMPTTPVDFDFRATHHSIFYEVDFSLLPTDQPLVEIKTVVLQNDRYDNAIVDVRAQFSRGSSLVFNHPTKNIFEAGNEYRILDVRDLANSPSSIERIFSKDSTLHVIPFIDKKRAYKQYTRIFDHDGRFFIDCLPSNRNEYTESEYAFVHLRLKRKVALKEQTLYVDGLFNGGENNRKYQMVYNDSLEQYEAHLLLKQGVYNYAYTSTTNGSTQHNWIDTDGSHTETRNTYTVLVYYIPFGANYEQLVGIHRFRFQ